MTDAPDGGHAGGEDRRRAPSSDGRGGAWWRWGLVVVAGIGATVLLLLSLDGPADPFVASAAGPAPPARVAEGGSCTGGTSPRRPLDGFASVTFRVTSPSGAIVDGCALLADTPGTRGRGLMGQQDLRGYDAMVFRFDGEVEHTFFMFDTVLPLSIAFIGSDGGIVSTVDMDPCPEADASACPSYASAGSYRHAVEVSAGDLPTLGIVPGATVTFGDRQDPS